MLASWMLHLIVLAGLLLATAAFAERAIAAMRRPRRWVWVAALIGAVVLAAAGPIGPPAPSPIGAEVAHPTTEPEGVTAATTAASPLAPMSGLDRALALGWLASSLAFLAYVLRAALVVRRSRRGWSRAEVDGEEVWITGSTGPAILGIVRPRVVLPSWLMEWAPSERDLVIRHEREHASAGDPWLNALGLVVLGLMPWNPFLWWGRRRLVQAIELDCDARVLRSATDPRSYAEVLLEVSRWTVPIRPSVAVLTATCSQLERRIEMAMKHDTRRPFPVGITILAVAGIVAIAMASANGPSAPSGSYLAGLAPVAQEPAELDGGMIPGRLPFTPTPEQISTALAAHHPRVLARGLPEDQRIWFVIDTDMRILHTGVGPVAGLHERVRALHPESVTDYSMELGYESVDGLSFLTVWFVPDPTEGPGG